MYFYPRPPRGGRRWRLDYELPTGEISIHALREEGDVSVLPQPISKRISIHALREEGDWSGSGKNARWNNFYPRPPRGGRRQVGVVVVEDFGFLSTPSARRATRGRRRTGCKSEYFYPRSPRGGRRYKTALKLRKVDFLSTPSARRATSSGSSDTISVELFLSTPSARRATHHKAMASGSLQISIHALREEGDLGAQVRAVVSRAFLSTPSARRATRQKSTIFTGH